ncbi:hypothetical protein HF290_16990 [Acidithiobacillus ferrooxidans]|uniref:hypothetical protein n=1 Tax=Acidithiobacillus ferrooxidans TaxID=920 RepID=UPI001C07932F|nr:hypothetical protein [Acidithiobacillus ferrooxidans]MBU2862012.1 hypothetical protein [Acidithiobacillus ferrooxidans]
MKIMKKQIIAVAVLSALVVPVFAVASTSVGIGFHNTTIDGQSLPAATLNMGAVVGKDYLVDGDLVDGAGNHMNYFRGRASVGKLYSFLGGVMTPELLAGYERLGYGAGHLSAAYAGAGVTYTYQMGDLGLAVGGSVGRDFDTSASVDPATVGGLFYEGEAAVDFSGFGPGVLDISYRYRHLPISVADNLHLNTSSVGIGYHVAF